jgi:DNA-binding transcriptional regulator GbsR (MarR family)
MGPFWGVSAAAARVYGWLISKNASVTADDLMAGLSMSRGAVSMACRELRDWGIIHATRETGARQVTYRAETNLDKIIRNIVQTRKRREWDPVLERLREWIPRLQSDRSVEAQEFCARLKSIESIVSMVDSLAESFLKGGTVQRLGLAMLTAAANRKKARKEKS